MYKILQWALDHKQRLLYGGLTLALLLVVGYRVSFSRMHKRQGQFATAAKAYREVLTEGNEESLVTLQRCLKRCAPLRDKYDAAVAQSLLTGENPHAAKAFAKRALARTEERSGDYANFAKTTLLISEHEYTTALENAQKLKEKLADQNLLWAYNQMRIALLQQELGQPARKSWRELLSWINAEVPEGTPEKLAREQFFQAFHAGHVGVRDFVQAQL